MTTKNYDQPQREKQPELKEVIIGFQEQGKRFEDALNRITKINNRIQEDPGLTAKEGLREPSPRVPGLLNDFINIIDGYRAVADKIENQIHKLETFI